MSLEFLQRPVQEKWVQHEGISRLQHRIGAVMFWGQGGSLVMASGEGSRGGKVIDHTRSGKPIYDTTLSQNSTEHEGHKSFDKNDHADAAHAHSKAAKALRQPKKLSQNYWKKKAHENAARDHSQIANKNHPAYHKAPFGSKDWRG